MGWSGWEWEKEQKKEQERRTGERQLSLLLMGVTGLARLPVKGPGVNSLRLLQRKLAARQRDAQAMPEGIKAPATTPNVYSQGRDPSPPPRPKDRARLLEERLSSQERTTAFLLHQALRIRDDIISYLQGSKGYQHGETAAQRLLENDIQTMTSIIKKLSQDIEVLEREIRTRDGAAVETNFAVQSLDHKFIQGLGDLRGRVARCEASIAKLAGDISIIRHEAQKTDKEIYGLHSALKNCIGDFEKKVMQLLGKIETSSSDHTANLKTVRGDQHHELQLLDFKHGDPALIFEDLGAGSGGSSRVPSPSLPDLSRTGFGRRFLLFQPDGSLLGLRKAPHTSPSQARVGYMLVCIISMLSRYRFLSHRKANPVCTFTRPRLTSSLSDFRDQIQTHRKWTEVQLTRSEEDQAQLRHHLFNSVKETLERAEKRVEEKLLLLSLKLEQMDKPQKYEKQLNQMKSDEKNLHARITRFERQIWKELEEIQHEYRSGFQSIQESLELLKQIQNTKLKLEKKKIQKDMKKIQ
ncbi:protein FAM81B [Rhynochetos jubatus]